MSKSKDERGIRKEYGEQMWHLCRTLFPTILEEEGKLLELLQSSFGSSRSLYEDITKEHMEEKFKNYIYSGIDVEGKYEKSEGKTPKELLEEAGYDFFECHSEEDIQSFKKYYAPGEELCTFHGGRLKLCMVFWAVRKGVDSIRRENFSKPSRQDEYGTSVMSIQFTRGKRSTVSIKNRYNDIVNNPDATFSNNLDNIVPGLEESFEREYGINLELGQNNLEIPGYRRGNDGRFYKVNKEINNICYCENNVIIDKGEVKKFSPEKEIIIDNFILDLEKKEIRLYDSRLKDSFTDGLDNMKNIVVKNEKNEKGEEVKRIIIKLEGKKDVEVAVDKCGNIIGYTDENLTSVGDYFLYRNEKLRELNLPSLTSVGDYFLYWNRKLREINLPSLTSIEDSFLGCNTELREINLPLLTSVGNDFLLLNKRLREINLPSLTSVGNGFLRGNTELREINLPALTSVGNSFLTGNTEIREINLPALTSVGNGFLRGNTEIREINLPALTSVGNGFLKGNTESREKILAEIEGRKKAKVPTPKDIAIMDKNLEITTSEVHTAEMMMGRVIGKDKSQGR